MDPISIITLAGSTTKATYQVAQYIYLFINSVKTIDKQIETLSSEITGLRRVLDAIRVTFENPLVRSEKAISPENTPIWAAVVGALEDCRKTMEQLDRKIGTVEGNPKRRSLFRSSLKVTRLNVLTQDITTLRAQINSHANNLQVSLQMVNILISGLSPHKAVEGIGSRIDDLTAALSRLQLTNVDSQSDAGSIASAGADAPPPPPYQEQLQRSARTLLADVEGVLQTGVLKSASSQEKQLSASLIKRTMSEFRSSLYRTDSGFSTTTTNTDTDESDSGSDSDDAVEHTLCKRLFAKGASLMLESRHEEAEAALRSGLRHARNVRALSADIDLERVQLQLSIACLHQRKLEEAELMFVLMLSEWDAGTKTDTTMLQACHYLAISFLCQYEFESALSYATQAVKGRRRLLGKTHASTRSSIALLSLIYRANGDLLSAQTYAAKLPLPSSTSSGSSASAAAAHRRSISSTPQPNPHSLVSASTSSSPADPFDPINENALALQTFPPTSTAAHLLLTLKQQQSAIVALSAPANSNYYTLPSAPLSTPLGRASLSLSDALIWAAETNSLLAGKWLLSHGAPPGSHLRPGRGGSKPALTIAAHQGHAAFISLLLSCGASPDSADADNTTGAMWAANRGHYSAVRTLLDAGYKVNTRNNSGETALSYAADKGHEPIVALLLSRGADPNIAQRRDNPLTNALGHGWSTTAALLINAGADLYARNAYGSAALHLAASSGATDIVEMLLAKGVSPSLAMEDGRMPLHLSAPSGHEGVVRALLARGAQVDARDNEGKTAAWACCESGGDRAVAGLRVLLQAGADARIKNIEKGGDGVSAVGVAKRRRNECLVVLKEYGFELTEEEKAL